MLGFQRQVAWLYIKGLAFASAFGAIGAAAAQAFRWALEAAGELMFGSAEDITVAMAQVGWQWKLLLPAVGGALAGAVLLLARRFEARSGRGDYLEVIDGSLDSIPLAASLLRCLASFFSIVSGGSVGKEGAMVQLSATAGSVLTRVGPNIKGERFQLAIAMAATGGLAAVYHTPLAAAIFIAEIALGGIEFRRVALLFTAAVAATWVTMLTGQYSVSFTVPIHEFNLDAGTMLAVMGVSLAAGLAGSMLLAAIGLARRGFAQVPGGLVTQMALGGLLVGCVILVAPEVAGNGYAPIARLLREEPMTMSLVVLLMLKIGATAATVGSGAVGGLFTPALLVGALTGMEGAAVLNQLLPAAGQNAILLGVVGMAAALAATTQAPLMSTLMVFEMTREPTLIFPIMLSAAIAYGVTSVLGQTGTYAVIARHRSRFDSRNRLLEITVAMVMRPVERYAHTADTLAQAREAGMAAKNRFVFVVDEAGRFAGAAWMQDLLGATDAASARVSDFAPLQRDFPTVHVTDRVRDVWETVVASPAERIPVLADATSRKLVGVLHKSDVLARARDLLA